jgi:hypothetical protein
MPYKIEQRADKFVVVREDGGRVVGTHSSRAKATAHVRALYANVKDAIEKAKFASRSEAGKYAAHIRWMRERGMEPLTPDAWRSQNAQPVQPTRSSYESSLDAITSFASDEFQSRLRDAGASIRGSRYDGGRLVPLGEYLNIQNEMSVVRVRNPNNPVNTIIIGSPPLMAVEREVNELGGLVHNAILEKMKQDGHILPNGEFNTAKHEALMQVRDESQAVVDEIRAKAKELGLQQFTGYENGAQTEEMKIGWRGDPKDIDTADLPPRLKNLHEKWDTLHQEFYEIPWSERDANVSKREQLDAAKDEYEKAALADFETWFNANHNPSGSGSHKDQFSKISNNHNNNMRAVWSYPNYVDRYAESFSKVMEDLNISAKSQIGKSDQIDLSRSRLTKAEKEKFARDIHTFFPAKAIKIFSDRYGLLKVTKSKGGGHWNVSDVQILTSNSEGTNIHEFMHA